MSISSSGQASSTATLSDIYETRIHQQHQDEDDADELCEQSPNVGSLLGIGVVSASAAGNGASDACAGLASVEQVPTAAAEACDASASSIEVTGMASRMLDDKNQTCDSSTMLLMSQVLLTSAVSGGDSEESEGSGEDEDDSDEEEDDKPAQTGPIKNPLFPSLDEQIADLEKQLASMDGGVGGEISGLEDSDEKTAEAVIFEVPLVTTTPLSASSVSTPAQAEACNLEHKAAAIINSIHATYEELHNAAPPDLVHRMRLAMKDIPEGVAGLDDCRRYLTQKQHYTLQDMLVVQYILNDGILMRQMHNTGDEYHVDLSEQEVES